MTTFERLKIAAGDAWENYIGHRFIREMEIGILPEAVFQNYLVQDYLFLIQFARAYALTVYKSRSLTEMRTSLETLNIIMDEMKLHVRLCERWRLSPTELEATPEHASTVAYTRYVLDCGMSGDLLDLHVALAPCVIGYAEIGKRLAPALLERPNHPYREWIKEYASDVFQAASQTAIAHIDRLAAHSLTEKRFDELAKIFIKASQLEADFWQMGYDIAQIR